jgi:K+-sensing histidine kinase KdpD
MTLWRHRVQVASLTEFAPAERADQKTFHAQVDSVAGNSLLQALIDAYDGYVLIVNQYRQILVANQRFRQDLSDEADEILGFRPGEVLECVRAADARSGCGTTRYCSTCGVVGAILACQDSLEPVTRECRVTTRRRSLDLRLRASPYRVGPHALTVLSFTDISAEKRREVLERTFFHDLRNTITGLQAWAELLLHVGGVDPNEVVARIAALTTRLADEVETHRMLSVAEGGELVPHLVDVHPEEVLAAIQDTFDGHAVSTDRHLAVAQPVGGKVFRTDRTLLLRVLTNMVKNAFEAIGPGETVTLGFRLRDGAPVFTVANPGAMDPDTSAQVFQRSFSTKGGSGRGIGTYSMKLFGEQVLGGKVTFVSTPEQGTVFEIALP